MSDFVEVQVRAAFGRDLSVREACDGWYSGAYLLETMPSALYVAMRHGSDPEEATIRAVNDTKDNDTIGAIVGCLVGALHGRSALPRGWIERLSGRTAEHDDGRVFGLIDQARQSWCACEAPGASEVAPASGLVTRAGIKRLLRFLPAFEHPDGPLYRVVAHEPSAQGPFTLQAILTRDVRADRFSDGYLCEVVDSGICPEGAQALGRDSPGAGRLGLRRGFAALTGWREAR